MVFEVNCSATKDGYRKQLRLYADALEKLTGIPTAECYVYLLSADTAVKM